MTLYSYRYPLSVLATGVSAARDIEIDFVLFATNFQSALRFEVLRLNQTWALARCLDVFAWWLSPGLGSLLNHLLSFFEGTRISAPLCVYARVQCDLLFSESIFAASAFHPLFSRPDFLISLFISILSFSMSLFFYSFFLFYLFFISSDLL